MGLFEDIGHLAKGVVKDIPGAAKHVGNAVEDVGHSDVHWQHMADAIGGAVSDIPHVFDEGAHQLGLLGGDKPPTPGLGVLGPDTAAIAAANKNPGKGPVATPAPPAVTVSNQAVGTANQAMDSLIAEYTKTLGAVTPYESGQVGQQAAGQATQMGQNIAAGGASAQSAFGNVDATQNADYQKMAAADSQGSAGVSAALGDLRSADAQALQVSPYAGLLTALTSGATYRAETNPQTAGGPTAESAMPGWLAAAYANSVGSNSLSVAGGTTPGTGSSSGATPATTPATSLATGISGGP
jgi:hypothetical protein